MLVTELRTWVADMALDTLSADGSTYQRWDSDYFRQAYREAMEQLIVQHPDAYTTELALTGPAKQLRLVVPAITTDGLLIDSIVQVDGLFTADDVLINRLRPQSLEELDLGVRDGIDKTGEIPDHYAFQAHKPTWLWLETPGLPEGHQVYVTVSVIPAQLPELEANWGDVPTRPRYNAQLADAILSRYFQDRPAGLPQAQYHRRRSLEAYQLAEQHEVRNNINDRGAHDRVREQ
ncbi:MAG: DUF6682 family protein [Pseudomonadota bacterium]